MLYNEYRPKIFDDVKDQSSTILVLKAMIKKDEISNIIFTGKHGTGKTTLARIVAKELETSDIDIHEIDAASHNSVDDIRNLITQLKIPPHNSKRKVYIIDEVHMLSKAAFDVLLKPLEESYKHVLFILCTTEYIKIPDTIKSRCTVFNLNVISIKSMINHMSSICTDYKREVDEKLLYVIAEKANGSMRDALTLLEKCLFSTSENLTIENLQHILFYIDEDIFIQLTELMIEGNMDEVIILLNRLINEGYDIKEIMIGTATYFRKLFMMKSDKISELVYVSDLQKEKMKCQFDKIGAASLFKSLSLIEESCVRLHLSHHKRLSLELLFINIQLTIKKK
jgi:DNA polymerase III subunit gamma/tau